MEDHLGMQTQSVNGSSVEIAFSNSSIAFAFFNFFTKLFTAFSDQWSSCSHTSDVSYKCFTWNKSIFFNWDVEPSESYSKERKTKSQRECINLKLALISMNLSKKFNAYTSKTLNPELVGYRSSIPTDSSG